MPRPRRALIGSDLWAEDSIVALTRTQQHAYLLAYTQPDLNRCGVLAYRPRRWARLSTDGDITQLEADFQALHDSRHVVLDDIDEQLFLRTYIRHDGILTQPQVLAALARDWHGLTSRTIRLAVLAELRRLWDLPLEDNERLGLQLLLGGNVTKLGVKNAQRTAVALGRGLAEPLLDAIQAGCIDPFDRTLWQGSTEGLHEGLTTPPTKGQSKGQREGQAEGQSEGQRQAPARSPSPVPLVPNPDPLVPDPDPKSPTGAAHATPRDVITAWIARCATRPPKAVIDPTAKHVTQLLDEGFTPDAIGQALDVMTARGLHPSTLPSVVHGHVNGATTAAAGSRNSQVLANAMARAEHAEATGQPFGDLP